MSDVRAGSAAALHDGQPVRHAGAALDGARGAIVLVHGRGGSAEDMLGLAGAIGAQDIAYLAPQAANSTWYPYPFTSPTSRNEPWLTSALAQLDAVTASLAAAGIPPARTLLLGFSQGACLTLEWTARDAHRGRRWGGVAALAGGLIGPDDTPRDYAGTLDGTPVLLGVGDQDHHIPVARVRESAAVMERLGAVTTLRLYPGLGHVIVQDEVEHVQRMVRSLGA